MISLLPRSEIMNGWCRCRAPEPMKAGNRLVIVEGRDRSTRPIGISEYCATCRGVLSPEGVLARVASDERDYDQGIATSRARARTAVGRTGDWKSLSLHPWNRLDEFVQVPYVRVGTTYTDWQRGHDREQIQNTLRRQVGLASGARSVTIPSVYKNGYFRVDDATVDHILRRLDEKDADHLSFFFLTPATLMEPLEVWELEPDQKDPFRRLYFMKLYRVGRTITTHFVIADDEHARIASAYRLNDADTRADGHRRGKLVYASWDRSR